MQSFFLNFEGVLEKNTKRLKNQLFPRSAAQHLLGSNKHTHLPQTDSLAQDAQHGEDQHNQVLLFLNCNFLHICAIYVYHLFFGIDQSE